MYTLLIEYKDDKDCPGQVFYTHIKKINVKNDTVKIYINDFRHPIKNTYKDIVTIKLLKEEGK
jgi:hypothetical protein